ncbi:unnamed protein product [Allacma fusca]|uniref:Uncharacterized protein n=1 Tax=Allacma fusca TaxID=39272 RepID=A0A8J2JXH4_9HEXA|nr:unnamed protein product [Allacma fusca]
MGLELALADLESSLQPEIFSYLLTVINAEQTNVEIVLEEADEKINASKSLGSDSTSGSSSILDKCDEPVNLSGNTISSTGSGSKVYLPSLHHSHRSIAPSSALCSHLPLCRKILFKLGHKETTKR